MPPRDRILSALDFRPVDTIPLQIFPAAGGLYEHGQKLVDLIRSCGHDFYDLGGLALPAPPEPVDFDPDGRYHAFRTDDWGTRWEYRIFGIWGHPIGWPLDDLANLATWKPPAPPPSDGPEIEAARVAAQLQCEHWPIIAGGGCGIFEKLFSLRRFEDVLMDIQLDTPEVNRIADLIAEHNAGHVRRGLALNADIFCFGDDFGTQEAPFFPLHVWRRFFGRRYDALFEPIRRAGKKIIFHSCGQIAPLLDEFASLGINAMWPQLPLFDLPTLARRCRELHLAVQLHPDRGDLMQHASPAAVRDYVVRLVDTFRTRDGGSWLYIEIDPGFPWANVQALFQTVAGLRQNMPRE
ncbi:MAG TPA: uroporphyrinogen decarboxylase family protein [Planctomycetota bacterium]|nr:uroporphyrinogen decarboxylase family protein [Planctomycetota bacterium]